MKNFQIPENAIHIKSQEDWWEYMNELRGSGKRPHDLPDRYPCFAVLAGTNYDPDYLDTDYFVFLYPEEPTIFVVVRECGHGDAHYIDNIFTGLDGGEAANLAQSQTYKDFPDKHNQWVNVEEWIGGKNIKTTCYEPKN